ncbi:hypothetical protein [Streptomyces sp. 039-1]|uniref:hypothetical protein n=1 Tax=Streptomyces sp. 039-1 TaxID=2789263 RepID=UPI0039F51281
MPTITLPAPADRTAEAESTPPVLVRGSLLDPRTVEGIGPRFPGAVYQNSDGRFEVLTLITDPDKVMAHLHRRQGFALIVRDTLRPDGQPFVVGSVWTESDWLIRRADRPSR